MKNIIVYVMICLVIIAGLAVWEAKGFKSELQFAPRKQIQLVNKTGIDKEEIKKIASEILGNTEFIIQPVENFGNAISIVSREMTEDQKEQIIKKFNEKYKTNLKNEDVEIVSISFTRIKDIIRPFLVPGVVSLILVTLYFVIRFKKLGIKSIIAKTLLMPVVAELLIFSIMAIARIPIGRLAIALGVGVYGAMIYALSAIFEQKREEYFEQVANK